MNLIQEDIGTQVKNIRKGSNLSQTELADLIGTDQNNISKIEAGKSNVTLSTLQRLAEAFKKNLRIFFED